MLRKEKEMVPNRYGIMVCKGCCCSCRSKEIDDDGIRKCHLDGRRVRSCHMCDQWSMSDELEELGCERGKVQCRAYQLTVLGVRTSELHAMMRYNVETHASVESIRKDFELQYGSRIALR